MNENMSSLPLNTLTPGFELADFTGKIVSLSYPDLQPFWA